VYKISHSWVDVLVFLMSFCLESCIWADVILTADQKYQRVNVCKELRQITSNVATFLSWVITGDKSWIYSYDPETKQQFSQWKLKSKAKSMLIFFFDIKGIIYKEFDLVGQTVNSAYYCDVLWQLCEDVQRLRPELWCRKNWLLHHNNTPSHTFFSTREFFTKNILSSPTHPTFLCFPDCKIKLKVRNLDITEVIEAESQMVLNTLAEHDAEALRRVHMHGRELL
jgi:hypothetical protein